MPDPIHAWEWLLAHFPFSSRCGTCNRRSSHSDVFHTFVEFVDVAQTGHRLPSQTLRDVINHSKQTWVLLYGAQSGNHSIVVDTSAADGCFSQGTRSRGNPGLRAKDPAALRRVRLARQDGYMGPLNETAQDWVPHMRRLRPDIA